MPFECSKCRRELAAVSDPSDPPKFCMYCGHRLAPDSAAEFRPVDSAEVLTKSFGLVGVNHERTATHSPANPHEILHEAPPPVVGGYRLVRSLGAGGMGAVYEGVRDDTGRRVAIKLLSSQLAANPHSIERFRQEGRLASQISHPRTVFVLGADTDNGRPYIVMELMPGTTLKDLVETRGMLPPTEAIAHILDVIDGLCEAHRLGVIHRDVKPSNCFLTEDDRVKVGDFGLSKSLGGQSEGHLTGTGTFLGTVLFASPEQIRSEPVSYESDVYSVSATLYFLLTGQAPYQDDTLTASLARAITEPPPSLREYRKDVSSELDRVVLRGLERERVNRWSSLDSLRDVLREQLPSTHRPARPRTLILAYLTDVVLLQFILVPLELILGTDDTVSPFAIGWTTVGVAVGYFIPAEGLLGTTAGKRLLRLRVSRMGETGPPGMLRAAVRTFVFHLMLFGTLIGLGWSIEWPAQASQRFVGLGIVAMGLAALSVQFYRGKVGYRGLHDRASGCHAILRPRPLHRTRMVSRFPNPLDSLKPSTTPLPSSVGEFAVKGKIGDLPDGGEVWIGEDPSLRRRVLIRVCAPDGEPLTVDPSGTPRPTRLRPVGHGMIGWNALRREWAAYVAPTGAPLLDVVDPTHPLSWADARSLLEQLVEELGAAEQEETGVRQPSVQQLWVEPGGRLQLLDFPLPTGRTGGKSLPVSGPAQPLEFLREVASLGLEGSPRSSGGPIQAPVPLHAAAVTDRLFCDGEAGYSGLDPLRCELAETHTHASEVTTSTRAAHLGVQGAMLAFGLVLMFAVSGFFSWFVAVTAAAQVWGPLGVRSALADSETRAAVLAEARRLPPEQAHVRQRLEKDLNPDRLGYTLAVLDRWIVSRELHLADQRIWLTGPEQRLLDRVGAFIVDEERAVESSQLAANAAVYLELAHMPDIEGSVVERRGLFLVAALVVLGVPIVWAGFAFAFHGGVAMRLAGITVLRLNGRPAGRFRCAVRELIVWLPVTTLLLAGLWVQAVAPQLVLFRTVLWLAAVGLLPLYVVMAMRDPARPPQDRIMGTSLVPD